MKLYAQVAVTSLGKTKILEEKIEFDINEQTIKFIIDDPNLIPIYIYLRWNNRHTTFVPITENENFQYLSEILIEIDLTKMPYIQQLRKCYNDEQFSRKGSSKYSFNSIDNHE